DTSEHYHNAAHNFESHGIGLSNLKIDVKKMIERKNEVIAQNTAGITFLFKKNKIETYEGVGSFVDKNTIKVTKTDGSTEELKAKNINNAAGCERTSLPFLPIDKERNITSTEA